MYLIVTNGLVFAGHQQQLHPSIAVWNRQLSGYRQQWFECADKNPLAWYAALCDLSPAALLAARCADLPDDAAQCWVASPYHGELVRQTVRVLPEGQFSWTAAQAHDLCETLNPLLAEDGMQMFAVGAAVLAVCREPMHAYPTGFGAVSGQLLPDRHHEGADGGRLNRLLSEIQMLLFQQPSLNRHQQGQPDVNGIWLWAPTPIAAQTFRHAGGAPLAVTTRNPTLQSIIVDSAAGVSVDRTDTTWIISEAERLAELLKQDAALPRRILLAGQGYAVLLTKSLLHRFSKPSWRPKSVKHESVLLSRLRSLV